jgi:hypothetical protein
MAFCDKLIDTFQEGHLPLVEGIKLNDFLANMLKSKQSRLTKKMKNAKLSAKSFKATTGYIISPKNVREFSELENSFYHSVECHMERAEIRFHMQKEWREQFSSYCVAVGQPLDADAWLSSVEEMDRRASLAKDAARMARRKLMMGYALTQDAKNPDQGVFIDQTGLELSEGHSDPLMNMERDPSSFVLETEEMLSLLSDAPMFSLSNDHHNIGGKNGKCSSSSSPFLTRVVSYMQRHHVPFEHIDAWVPSFVPGENAESDQGGEPKCRLCYAGSITADSHIGSDGRSSHDIPADISFNMHAFGEYSQKFSFDVGCGLPGRVYQSGVPTWEQSVQNAPHHHFERCGGALQWGLKTVVGIPIASPNVGRIVIVLYSCFNRDKDQELVGRLSDEFTKVHFKMHYVCV